MPVWKSFYPDNYSLGKIWKITETEEELLNILQDDPYSILDHFEGTNRQKRIEYICSRLLVKELCDEFSIRYHRLLKDDHNKPYLEGSICHISLSHSSDYCAAVVHSAKKIGIDIQKLDPKLDVIARKFLSDSEINSFNHDLEKLCIAWCSKEAAYKLIGKKGVSLKHHLTIIKEESDHLIIESSSLEFEGVIVVNHWNVEDHSIAVAIEKP